VGERSPGSFDGQYSEVNKNSHTQISGRLIYRAIACSTSLTRPRHFWLGLHFVTIAYETSKYIYWFLPPYPQTHKHTKSPIYAKLIDDCPRLHSRGLPHLHPTLESAQCLLLWGKHHHYSPNARSQWRIQCIRSSLLDMRQLTTRLILCYDMSHADECNLDRIHVARCSCVAGANFVSVLQNENGYKTCHIHNFSSISHSRRDLHICTWKTQFTRS
jgi:hypothetical protein